MKHKTIKLTLSPRGKVHIEMEGFAGEACLSALTPLLKSLGSRATLTPTADYYLPNEETTIRQDLTTQ